jgi:gamma-glutamyltranspeptidase/glutathione hydrolase
VRNRRANRSLWPSLPGSDGFVPSSRPTVRPFIALALPLLGLLACRPAAPGTGIGVVAAPTPEAAQAGVLIMEAGGNAIDAAVAISFALGVTEPAMSGLGGQTQILLAAPGAEPILINGTSFAPGATPDAADAEDITGYRATTVPTTVRVLDHAWRRFGSGRMAWADLLTPAIRFAERGFVPGPFRRRVWEDFAVELAANPAARRFFLLENGEPPGRHTFTQPVLAATLRRLAEHGADDFYRGAIAREIAADMEANGGWLTLADLEGLPDPVVVPALQSSYRGYRVFSAPPPAGGWVVLRVLNLLDRESPRTLSPGRNERTVRLAEALRIGHRERRDEPVRDLVDYGPEMRRKLDRTERPAPGDGDGQTTHFSVVDPDGMVVAVTASVNYGFGAKVANATLGFLYNDYMREFVLGEPDHPFALRAGAMPYSSMSPTVVMRRGRPVLALGSPGSARIISAVVQVGELWMDGFARIEEAVAMPRIHVIPDSALFLEDPALADTATLEAAGFVLVPPRADWVAGVPNAYFGGVHAVALERGQWTGAADPRRDGVVRQTRDRGPVP